MWKDELDNLQQEKKRIEDEKQKLMQFKDKEDAQWQSKLDLMQNEHQQVI